MRSSFLPKLDQLGWANILFFGLVLLNIVLWLDGFEFIFKSDQNIEVQTSLKDDIVCASNFYWSVDQTSEDLFVVAYLNGHIISTHSERFKSKLSKIFSFSYNIKSFNLELILSKFRFHRNYNTNIIAQGFSLRGPPLKI